MLSKVAGAREAHGAPPGSYLVMSFVTLWPIFPLAVITVPAVWRRRGEDAIGFLLAWLIPCWLVFELVPTKLLHYVLPLYPAIALIVASAAQHGALLADRKWQKVVAFVLPVLPLAIAIVMPFATLLYGQLAGVLMLAGVMIHLPPARRVAARLALLAHASDAVPVTQGQLAEMTGLSRKTINVHLRALENAGAIGCDYRRIRIRNRARLSAIAQNFSPQREP